MTASRTEPTSTTCPPWCADHQPPLAAGDAGFHAAEVVDFLGTQVSVVQGEGEEPTAQIHGSDRELWTEDLRSLAHQLLEAADRIDGKGTQNARTHPGVGARA